MARKRMIDPSIWTDDGFMSLNPNERLLWLGLISHADDEGRGTAEPRGLRAKVFPADGLSDDDVAGMCGALARHMRVRFYAVDGARYYQLDRWSNHQYIKDRKPSTLPPPGGDDDVGPGAARERPDSGPGAARERRPMNESMNEGKEDRADSGPATAHAFVLSWFREFTKRTGKLLAPASEDFARGTKAYTRSDPATLEACIPRYFEHPFWFTAPRRGSAREYSFGNFLGHLGDIVSSLADGPAPPKAAKRLDVRRCPNGHLYAVEDGICMECGWKPGGDDDDEF